MQYKSVETYTFSIASEAEALSAFRKELRDANIPFTEEGGNFMSKIIITTNGNFDMIKKEDM